VQITPPKNKDGRVTIDFFPDVRRKTHSVSICSTCGKRRGDVLYCWPQDAFYQTEVRGVRLWARSRRELVDLRAYIAKGATRGQGYHKLPKTIVRAENRELVLKQIDRLLSAT
jgi:hypothetical protein